MTSTSWNCARNRRQRGKRLFGDEFVAPVLLEPRLRLAAAETALHVGPERRDDIIDRLTVWGARIPPSDRAKADHIDLSVTEISDTLTAEHGRLDIPSTS